MPRPKLFPIKKLVGFRGDTVAAIDKWRRKQADLPSSSEAIRRLVEIGLKARKK
jgi:hypothetical protein